MIENDLVVDNPILTEQIRSNLVDTPVEVEKKQPRDKKIVILVGLGISLLVLLIASSIASAIATQKLQNQVKIPVLLPTPTITQEINQVKIPDIWTKKLLPAKDSLVRLGSDQNQDDFLPPVFDRDIGP